MTVAKSLPDVLEALREHGLRRGVSPGPMAPRGALPTGQPALDEALRTDGWPRGALALIEAAPGSGATTLALGSLAAVQAGGGVVAYLDAAGSLDPASAARLGVRLEWLLVVRPADAAEAVELAAWLARDGRIDAMVLDLADAGAPRDLDRLAQLLVRSGGVTLLLTGAGGREAASVRVRLRRRAWLAVGRDLVGQRVEAVVERHRWALAGGRSEIDLFFTEGRRADPLLHAAAAPLEDRIEERPALQVVGA